MRSIPLLLFASCLGRFNRDTWTRPVVNVFALLIDHNGQSETVDLGSLYVNRDLNGFIRQISIEPYDMTDLEKYELHFDSFDQEIPELPRDVRVDQYDAYTCGFFDDEGSTIDLGEETYKGLNLERYDSVVRSAYRLYERATRGEPAFVGYTDHKRHAQLSIKAVLDVKPPLCHMPRREAVLERRRLKIAEQGRTLLRVFLSSEDATSKDLPRHLMLNIGTMSDGYPSRGDYILGVADKGRPLMIKDSGDLRIGDTQGFFTNIMASKIDRGSPVLMFMDCCQKTRTFWIERTEALV